MISTKWLRLLLVTAILSVSAITGCTQSTTTTTAPHVDDGAPVINITLLHTNDIHGHLLPSKATWIDADNPPEVGGVVTLSRYIAKYRAENPGRTLLFDAGDWYQGTPEGNESKGQSVIDMFNLLQYDAAALGNHEFDFGVDNVKDLVAAADFPVLCNNLADKATRVRPRWLPDEYFQTDIDGVRIIAFGLLTEETLSMTSEDLAAGYTLDTAINACRLAVAQYRGRCDILIALSHCGFDVDKELAHTFPELDVIIGGHSHTRLDPPYYDVGNQVIVAQTGSYLTNLGKLDLRFDRETRKIVGFEGSLIALDPAEQDLPAVRDEVTARLEEWTSGVAAEMNRVIAHTEMSVTKGRIHDGGPSSSPLGNWICDAMRAKTGADVAFHNRTGIRGGLIPGPITVRNMYEISPFDNTLVVVQMLGSQLYDVVNYALSQDKYFLETSGMVCEYVAGPERGRYEAQRLTVNGRLVHPERIYTVVTNSFIAAGGDHHDTFRSVISRNDTGINMKPMQMEYMEELGQQMFVPPVDERYIRVQQ